MSNESSWPASLPNCVCGAHDFALGGMQRGHGAALWFTCNVCKRVGVERQKFFWAVLMEAEPKTEPYPKGKDPLCNYIDDVLEPFWLAMKDRPLPDGKTWQEHDENGNGYVHVPAHVPPRLPKEVVLFISDRYPPEGTLKWRRVSHEESAKQLMPLDPRRVAAERYWQKFIAFMDLPTCVPVTNEYTPEATEYEPWFAFEKWGARITFGWRNSVVNIKVEREKEFDATCLVMMGQKADVTCTGRYDKVDDKHPFPKTKEFYIHSHSRGSTVNYMDAILRELEHAHWKELCAERARLDAQTKSAL